MYTQPKRSRPRISTTISERTFAILVQVAKDTALPNPGVTMDYIINDWVALKRMAIRAAAVREHEPQEQAR
jgi:hypothetical protein